MTRIIKHFGKYQPGTKYPWKDWSDGQIREVNHVEEFGTSQISFVSSIYRWAYRYDHIAEVHRVSPQVCQFRIYKP